MRSAARRAAHGTGVLVAALCALLLLSGRALAEVRLAPAPDGHLGAWLIAGPLTPHAARNLDPGRADPRAGERATGQRWAPRWRMVSHADGALDVRKELGVSRNGGPYALLGGTLELERALAGWLLLSADGGVTVYVDGEPVWSRDQPRLRDRSWDAIPLELDAGNHRLVLRLRHRGRHWAAAVRIVDQRDLLPPAGLSLLLRGTTERDVTALVGSLLTAELRAGVTETGYRPRCLVEYRRGAPRGVDLDASVEVRLPGDSANPVRADLGGVPVGPRAVFPLHVVLPPVAASQIGKSARPRRVPFALRVAGATRRPALWLSAAAPDLQRRAERLLDAIRRGPPSSLSDPAVATATLEWHLDRLPRAMQQRGRGAAPLQTAAGDLQRLIEVMEAGHDPVHQPGVIDLALRSELDERPAHLRLHVPASYRPGTERRYPLVVLLHGYNGSPEGITTAFLDSGSRQPRASVDGFTLAPNAHGNSFYRGPGEHAVLATLDWALRTYPIDPLRVSITGVSMGGTGTAHLALRYPERFAAAAPLCGYHSFFIRRDTRNRPLRAWERDRMHHWSPASVAASGRNLPLYVAHGTKDLPLENSRVLVRAYRQLGYSMHDEWPETGHSVWKETYAGARLWPWLTRHRRDPLPRHVTVRTNQLRYGTLDWVRIATLDRPGAMGQVDARIAAPDRVIVSTDSVREVELTRTAHLGGAVTVEIDGSQLAFGEHEPLRVRRNGAAWDKSTAAPAAAGRKRPGMEGPIRDALLGPVLYVYGTLDPATLRAEREVAQTLAKLRYQIDVRLPVLADRQVSPAQQRTHSLVLVGNARTNRILQHIDGRLPIRVQGDCVTLADQSHCGPEVGTIFVSPNPDHPDRYVVAVEAVAIPGLYRALSLPQLLPDFLVYDGGLAPAAGEQVLGSAQVLAGGFFDNDWSLPPRRGSAVAPGATP